MREAFAGHVGAQCSRNADCWGDAECQDPLAGADPLGRGHKTCICPMWQAREMHRVATFER